MPLPEVYSLVQLMRSIGITHRDGMDVGGYTNKEVFVWGITMDLDRWLLRVKTILRIPQDMCTTVIKDYSSAGMTFVTSNNIPCVDASGAGNFQFRTVKQGKVITLHFVFSLTFADAAAQGITLKYDNPTIQSELNPAVIPQNQVHAVCFANNNAGVTVPCAVINDYDSSQGDMTWTLLNGATTNGAITLFGEITWQSPT